MDALLKLSQEHEEVFESLAFFKKAMAVVNGQKTPVHIDDFNKLFQECVSAHFEYEEHQIFPKVLKSGSFQAQKIVRELQRDHIDIYAKLDKFHALTGTCSCEQTLAQMKKITEVAQAIIAMVIVHARKEDSKFFPLVKKLGIKL